MNTKEYRAMSSWGQHKFCNTCT